MNCEVASARRLRRNDYDTTHRRHETDICLIKLAYTTPCGHACTQRVTQYHSSDCGIYGVVLAVMPSQRSFASTPAHRPHPPSRSTSRHNRTSRCCCGRWPCRRGIAGNGAVGGSAGGGSVGGGRWQFRRWQCRRDGIAVGGSAESVAMQGRCR